MRIIAVGKIKEKFIKEGVEEYIKRLKPFCKLEIIELKDEGIEKEAERIRKYIDSKTFVLDADGKEMKSEEFAKLIESNATFIIGGPDGIKNDLKKNTISLSKMTFTHEMTRLFLLEQIYRSFMILNHKKYHR